MAKTVVGLFNSSDDAQNVKRDLVNRGYAAEDITIVSNGATAGPAKAAGAAQGTAGSSETGIGAKISSFFRSLAGGGKDEEDYYMEKLRKGGALVAVTVSDDRADKVAEILENYGAKDVNEQTATSARTTSQAGSKAQTAIPVVEEELKVGTRQVQRGGVRVYSHVTEQPVEANVQLREEHIRVERRPLDRPATEADFNSARDQAIELRETGEEPVVEKTSRVVEEVVVGKEATERSETIRDTVRKTEVKVENVGASQSFVRSFSDYEPEFRRDFQTNYAKSGASYDIYAPAYQYGHTLATDPRYSSSDWPAIEPQARTEWSREGKGSWEQFKAAIRSAWDRVRSR